MVAALLLAGLFFRFGVEQRLKEIGTLRSLGFARPATRNLLLLEGTAIAVVGALAGAAGALAYAWIVVYGLRTWWVDAVGTTLLSVHISAPPLVYGAIGGSVSAVVFLLVSLRQLRHATPRGLLTGDLTSQERLARARGSVLWAGWIAIIAAAALISISAT